MKSFFNLTIVLAVIIGSVFGDPKQQFEAEFAKSNVTTNNDEQCRSACLAVGGTGTFTKFEGRQVEGKEVRVTVCQMQSASTSNVQMVVFSPQTVYYLLTADSTQVTERVYYVPGYVPGTPATTLGQLADHEA